ncbi:MAG: FG-GAP repeat protein [Crocosphaera sp.]
MAFCNCCATVTVLNIMGAANTGTAYLFDIETGNLLDTFKKSDPTINDWFGYSVFISGTNALIGAVNDKSGLGNGAAAYFFDTETGFLRHTFRNPTPQDIEDFFWRFHVYQWHKSINWASRTSSNAGLSAVGVAYLYGTKTGIILRATELPIIESGLNNKKKAKHLFAEFD